MTSRSSVADGPIRAGRAAIAGRSEVANAAKEVLVDLEIRLRLRGLDGQMGSAAADAAVGLGSSTNRMWPYGKTNVESPWDTKSGTVLLIVRRFVPTSTVSDGDGVSKMSISRGCSLVRWRTASRITGGRSR